jgi:prepilin-type N-terminal cleavage/methylation domain-containing protein
MVSQIDPNEEGYTLVEILVALAIMSVVLSLVSVTFIFISGRMAAWDNQISFYNNFHIVNDQLYNDLFMAKSVVHTDTTLSIELSDNRIRNYTWTKGNLKVNSQPFLADRDSVWIRISEYETTVKGIKTITYHLLLKNEGRSMKDSTVIQLRKPLNWEPIE